MMIKKWAVATALVCAFTPVAAWAGADALRVDNAWVRLLPGNLPAAGYFTLHNDSARAVTLTDVQSADFGMAMMHRSDMKTGRMLSVNQVVVPAHGEIHFQPEGYHVMLMHAKEHLSPGDKVPMTLTLSNGQTLKIQLTAKNAAGQ